MRKILFFLVFLSFLACSPVSIAGLLFSFDDGFFPSEMKSNQNLFANFFSPIAFMVGQNYFPGAFVFMHTDGTGSIKFSNGNLKEVLAGTEETSKKYCATQLRGFYYSQGRGERLWPLDSQTLEEYFTEDNLLQLTADSAVYTNCVSDPRNPKHNERLGLYLKLEHSYDQKPYDLSAGVQYTGSVLTGGINQPIVDSPLSLSFVRLPDPTT